MKTVLITGAAGDIGTHLRRELAGKYRIRASDLRDLKENFKGQKFTRADIAKFADALRTCGPTQSTMAWTNSCRKISRTAN